MGGLQMYMNDVPMPGYFRWCTSSFSLDLKANSAAKRATHRISFISGNVHNRPLPSCPEEPGIREESIMRVKEMPSFLGQNLWLPPRAVVATTKCTIVVETVVSMPRRSALEVIKPIPK